MALSPPALPRSAQSCKPAPNYSAWCANTNSNGGQKSEVSGRDASTIQTGQAARLTLPNGESVTGTVRLVAPTLDPNTRNATVYISLPNGSPAKTGMFAEGEILTGATKAMTLPQAAVILRDGNHYVFEVSDDNRVQQRLVKIGRTAQGQTEIRDGINASARVVMTGGGFLNDGDTVQIVDKPVSSTGDKP
ncbi:efflux RND transporter periplasmic adaptor subunit [Thiothrix subterranea]|uniref:Efflux RND transporter periplasmic adaptor subunit n=1 Tax=Thiothrix subterranea TaxID=2735563 RepID=A0AA51R6U6_9GAMM|nr:efflux RND transporter periplasmic adaptor subunit [Thiothrix subterranea]WML89046.1 efflux RND transporter periplasmic adaptor subunit [Thiothrix subterranea]